MKDRKKRDIRLYVKDYCGKDIDDPEYNSLTMSQRYLWDACCRVRGRSGRNLRNDAAWVSRACGVLAAERSVVGHNLAVIVSLGFLIPTNEEVSPSDSDTEDSCSNETPTNPVHGTTCVPCESDSDSDPELAPAQRAGGEEPKIVRENVGTKEGFLAPEKRTVPASVSISVPTGFSDEDPDAPKVAKFFAESMGLKVPRKILGYNWDVCNTAFEKLLKEQKQSRILQVIAAAASSPEYKRGCKMVKDPLPWDWFIDKFEDIEIMMEANEEFKQGVKQRSKELAQAATAKGGDKAKPEYREESGKQGYLTPEGGAKVI